MRLVAQQVTSHRGPIVEEVDGDLSANSVKAGQEVQCTRLLDDTLGVNQPCSLAGQAEQAGPKIKPPGCPSAATAYP